MNTLGCLDRPTTGSYKLAGQEMAHLSRDERAGIRNQRIGFVFQNYNLLNRTSALENVELALRLQAVQPALRHRRALEALEIVGLSARVQHRALELSGGEQQRVALARALVHEPRFVVADEPTGNLDLQTGQAMTVALIALGALLLVGVLFRDELQQLLSRLTQRPRS